MNYDLYSLDIFDYIDYAIPKKIRKKTTFNQQMLLSSAIASTVVPNFFKDLLFSISYRDKIWVEKGKKIIFFDGDMANDLIFSKALVNKASQDDFVLTLPFNDFMVALPTI